MSAAASYARQPTALTPGTSACSSEHNSHPIHQPQLQLPILLAPQQQQQQQRLPARSPAAT
jgi:hypothetical protein